MLQQIQPRFLSVHLLEASELGVIASNLRHIAQAIDK